MMMIMMMRRRRGGRRQRRRDQDHLHPHGLLNSLSPLLSFRWLLLLCVLEFSHHRDGTHSQATIVVEVVAAWSLISTPTAPTIKSHHRARTESPASGRIRHSSTPSFNTLLFVGQQEPNNSSSSSSSSSVLVEDPSPPPPPQQIKGRTVKQIIQDEDAPAGIVGAAFFGGNKQKEEFYDPVAEAQAGRIRENVTVPTFDRFADTDRDNADGDESIAFGGSRLACQIGQELTQQIQTILYGSAIPSIIQLSSLSSMLYAANVRWITPISVDAQNATTKTTSSAMNKNPLDALSVATRFYRNLDVAVTGGRPKSSSLSALSSSSSSHTIELFWEVGLTWPIFWEPRVVLCFKSLLTLNEQRQIVEQVDTLATGKNGSDNNDMFMALALQVLPRFWDMYHIGMTPSAEVSPRQRLAKRKSSIFSKSSSYKVYDLPARWVWRPSLIDTGTQDDANALILPDHAFTTAIKTMGPEKDEFVPTSPVEVQLLSISSSSSSSNPNPKQRQTQPLLQLQWSIPVAVGTLASSRQLMLPHRMTAEDDDPYGQEENGSRRTSTSDSSSSTASGCYVWQAPRRVATIRYGGNPQDADIPVLRKALYDQVIRDGTYTPKLLDNDDSTNQNNKRPIFFFWQNTVKACYLYRSSRQQQQQQSLPPSGGLGMAVYEARPAFTQPNEVGMELVR